MPIGMSNLTRGAQKVRHDGPTLDRSHAARYWGVRVLRVVCLSASRATKHSFPHDLQHRFQVAAVDLDHGGIRGRPRRPFFLALVPGLNAAWRRRLTNDF